MSNGAVADPCNETLRIFCGVSTVGSAGKTSELLKRYRSGACDLGYVFVLNKIIEINLSSSVKYYRDSHLVAGFPVCWRCKRGCCC